MAFLEHSCWKQNVDCFVRGYKLKNGFARREQFITVTLTFHIQTLTIDRSMISRKIGRMEFKCDAGENNFAPESALNGRQKHKFYRAEQASLSHLFCLFPLSHSQQKSLFLFNFHLRFCCCVLVYNQLIRLLTIALVILAMTCFIIFASELNFLYNSCTILTVINPTKFESIRGRMKSRIIITQSCLDFTVWIAN